jgi:hypothetical protein
MHGRQRVVPSSGTSNRHLRILVNYTFMHTRTHTHKFARAHRQRHVRIQAYPEDMRKRIWFTARAPSNAYGSQLALLQTHMVHSSRSFIHSSRSFKRIWFTARAPSNAYGSQLALLQTHMVDSSRSFTALAGRSLVDIKPRESILGTAKVFPHETPDLALGSRPVVDPVCIHAS